MTQEKTQASPLPTRLHGWCNSNTPWQSGFISTLRAIAARTPNLPAIGHAELPSQEAFRIGQRAYMAFAPREIARMDWRDGKLQMQIFGPGIWGAQGAMPLHFTELVYSRI